MQPCRILIVEDESLVAMDMERMLMGLGYDIIPNVNSYHDAIEVLNTNKPDLVLLDINLNDTKTGIDLSKQLQQQYHLPFIYITSHSDKATMDEALVTKPHGYLLKPFDADDLYAAIEVAMSNFSGQPIHNEDDALLCKDALFIKTDKNFVRVEINDICWIESEHNYLYIISQKGKHIIRSNFKDFQQNVPASKFIQVHKSYMINLNKVDAFSHTDITINGKEIPLSRMYKDEFFACMKRIL
ncbi:MAG: response regulator [Chitinophagaceae bacterium]|nr:response regulator [Chitinophagaceae bacterium]